MTHLTSWRCQVGDPTTVGPMTLVAGKVVMVTGAGSGIGRAASLLYAAEGASHVAIVDRDGPGADATLDLLRSSGGSGVSYEVDVTDEVAVEDLVDGIVEEHGRIDVAFNNAGISHPSTPFHELGRYAWEEMLAVNLTGVFLCMKHELRHMVEAGSGAIVNTSSGAGVVPAPGQPHYTAAKHGVLGLTRSAASEYVRAGIRCNAVLPGLVDTPMIAGEDGVLSTRAREALKRYTPTGELLQPEQVAAVAVWLSSDAAGAVNGQSLVVDGGGILR